MGDVPEYSATPAADELFPLLHCDVRCTLVRIVGMHPCTSSCTVMRCTPVHIVGTGDAPLHCVAMHSSAKPFFSKYSWFPMQCVGIQCVPRCTLVHNVRMHL